MKRFLRNIRGSLFWEHALAVVMAAVVLVTLLPMDVKLAKANEEVLGSDFSSAVQMTSLRFEAQYIENGTTVSKSILGQPEGEPLYLPQDGKVVASMNLRITNPTEDITQKNYVYTLPQGLTLTGVSSTSLLDDTGRQIGTIGIAGQTVMIRFDNVVLGNTVVAPENTETVVEDAEAVPEIAVAAVENIDITARFDVYGTVSNDAYNGEPTCEIYFPAIAGNSAKTVTFSSLPLDVLATQVAVANELNTYAGNTGVAVIAADTPMAIAAAQDLFDNTTVTLEELILKAVYTDDDGTHVVELGKGDSVELPYDADINMRFEFNIGNGDAIVPGQEYVYKLPDSIRVDVDAIHQLEDENGESIGEVHISPDGTLTFVFNDNVKGQNHIPFYVQFEGGFSKDLQEEGKHADIEFPTQSGSFDIHVDTKEGTKKDEDNEPGEVDIYKSGNVITGPDGKRYIEWTVELGLNGRDTLTGVIQDSLPDGLTYAEVPGYPQLTDNTKGKITGTKVDASGRNIEITVEGVDTYWRAKVKFLTSYDENIFTNKPITENTSGQVSNTAKFTPDDDTPEVDSTGTVRVTPDLVQKSGASIDKDGRIQWTVVLNREHMNIAGATYTDTIGAGQTLDIGSIVVSPSQYQAYVSTDENGKFTINFPDGTPITDEITITYYTEVEDFSQSKYENQADLDKAGVYDVTKKAEVNGLDLIDKVSTDWDPVTGMLTWQIVVNNAGQELENVVVTDTFDTTKMSYVKVEGATLAEESDAKNGKLIFKFDKLTERKVITVYLRVNPDFYNKNEGQYVQFENNVSMTSSLNEDPVTDRADRWTGLTPPDLVYKSGQNMGDGTILWTVEVKAPLKPTTKIELTDILPDDMEYVEGSFTIQNQWYDANPVKREPTISDVDGKKQLSFVLDNPNDPELGRFFTQAFWFTYRTKITNLSDAMAGKTYENHADLEVTYEGDITVDDSADATVTGPLGGLLDKQHSYHGGTDVVTWTVVINAARNDMSEYKNPKISDQLADYFDYLTGTLYKVNADGTRTEVSKDKYKAVCVNRLLTVILPEIGSDCYEFEFQTRFNCLPAELDGVTIVNHVSFLGEAGSFENSNVVNEEVSFSSSSAGSSLHRQLQILKVDSVSKKPLPGARFEIYLDDVLIGEAVSGDDGYAVFEGLNPDDGYTFVLKETETPDGYTGAEDRTITSQEFSANLKEGPNGLRYYEVEIENVKIQESTTLTITKKDTQGKNLAGARFGLYAEDRTTLLKTATSLTNGTVSFTVDKEGTYYIKEIQSPEGYVLNSTTVIKVDVTQDDSGTWTVTYDGNASATVSNTKAVGSLEITKTGEANALLSGAVFGLYSDPLANDLIESRTTNGSGVVTFENLELGKTYYYREDKAPDGYILDNTIHAFTVGTGKERVDVTSKVTISNERAIGNIRVYKIDNSSPAKPLQGVTFTLYKNGAPYPNASNPMTARTDANGIAVFKDVPFGEYTIRETGSLTGYRAVVAETEVIVDRVGNIEVTVVNELIRFNIRVVKQDEDGQPLAGAVFGLYNDKDLLQRSGTTGPNGELTFNNVAYGNYYIKEITPPEGYKPLPDGGKRTITPTEMENGLIVYTVENEKQNGTIEFSKYFTEQDEGEKPLPGATFTLYDENGTPVGEPYITGELTSSDPEGTVRIEGLPWGTYYLRESQPPEGYIRNDTLYVIEINSDTETKYYYMDGTEKKEIGDSLKIENVAISTEIPIISLKILKEESGTHKPLRGAVFRLYVDGEPTDYTAMTDGTGYAYFRRISMDEFDEPGKEWETRRYTVVEEVAPDGYKKISTPIVLNVQDMPKWKDEEEENPLEDYEIVLVATVENDPILGSIVITKNGTSSTTRLNGAEFTLYSDAACTKKVTGTGIVNPVTTSGDGTATFNNLPVGTYYVKETKAPAGYTLNMTAQRVVVSGANSETPSVAVSFSDSRIQLKISKQDIAGTQEVQGASLVLKVKATGEEIDSWKSGAEPRTISSNMLVVGTTYVLEEVTAPAGYGYANAIEFMILEDGTIQILNAEGKLGSDGKTVIMQDRKVTVSVNKQGLDADGSRVDEPALLGATLAIYQGNKELCHWTSNGQRHQIPEGILVAPKTGYTVYTLREISAPDGYLLAQNIYFAVNYDGKIYKADARGNIDYDSEITNGRITMDDVAKKVGDVYIRKVDSSTGITLPDAEFELVYAGDGEPVEGYESFVSTETLITIENLEVNTHYILRETSAPAGYVGIGEIEFHLDDSSKIVIDSGNGAILNTRRDTITVQNNPITLKIRKQDEWGTLLPGAILQLSTYDRSTGKAGDLIVEFKSQSDQSVVIDCTLLECGQSYVLHEKTPPEGYRLAEDIIFTIDENGKVKRDDNISVHEGIVIMQDDEAGLSVIKVSKEDGLPLSGSTLLLTSVDDPHWRDVTWVSNADEPKTWEPVEVTPGCTYVLTEIEAPNGYAFTDPIVFTIDKDDKQVYIDGVLQPNRTVRIADGMIKLTVSKQDIFDKVEVPNAELGIYDANGKLIVSWITGTEAITVDTSSMVTDGEGYVEYTLREINVPNGYYKADDIHFAVDRDGFIYIVGEDSKGQKTYTLAEDNLITMFEEPKFSISKRDMAGDEVPGATLTVRPKNEADDPDFDSRIGERTWVSGEEQRFFEEGVFKPGVTYVLTEENAPDGYAYAESIEFMIDEDGTVYVNGVAITNRRVEMIDDAIQVFISKQDLTNGRELSGAHLSIADADGNVIYSYVTSGQPTLLPKEIFKAPKPGEMAYYSLTEVTAPDGYEIAETIYFAIDSKGNVYVRNAEGEYVLLEDHMIVMKDRPTDESSLPGVPKTGDSTPIRTMMLLGMVSLFGFLLMLYFTLFGKKGIWKVNGR